MALLESVNQLYPQRVYFTEFDRITYSQVAWTLEDVEQIKSNLVRKLKLLILTKGHIVIATSHLLESEIAREIILPNPELISKRIIVPALRSDFRSCADFLDSKRKSSLPGEAILYKGIQQEEVAQLIDSTGLALKWDPNITSTWFKTRLVDDLRSEESLLKSVLKRHGFTISDEICNKLQQTTNLSRGLVYQFTADLQNLQLRETINNYADFIYYLSGAKAVQSEGVLPQANIIDFSTSELHKDNCNLSDNAIFFKLFIDAVKAVTSTHFPCDLLDALTIDDTIHLHQIALQDKFIQKYNEIQTKTKNSLQITDPEKLVLLIYELAIFEKELYNEFLMEVNRELPFKLRNIQIDSVSNLINAIANLVILPYSILISSTEILISGLRLIDKNNLMFDIEYRIEQRMQLLKQKLKKMIGNNQPSLLNFIEELKREYISNLRNPYKI